MASQPKIPKLSVSTVASTSTVNLTFPFIDFANALTSTLTRAVYKNQSTVTCQKCRVTLKRNTVLRHIMADHPVVLPAQARYRMIPLLHTFECICTAQFDVLHVVDFIQHVWTCVTSVNGSNEPPTIALQTALTKFIESELYSKVRAVILDTPPVTDTASSTTDQSEPASEQPAAMDVLPKTVTIGDINVTDQTFQRIKYVADLFERYPMLKELDLTDLSKFVTPVDILTKLSTFNLSTDRIFDVQVSAMDTQQFQARLIKLTNNYMRTVPTNGACLLCTDQGLEYKGSSYALLTHYTKHLTSSHSGQPLVRVCGGCRKRLVTDSDSRLALYCYHVAACHTRQPTLRFYNYKTSLSSLCFQYYVPEPDYTAELVSLELDVETYTHGLLDHYEEIEAAYSRSSLTNQLQRMDAHVALQQTHIYHLPHDLNTAKRLDDARAMVSAGDHLYCRRCALDYRAMQDGAFDPSSLSYEINRPRYAGPRERIISVRSSADDWNFFLSRDAFYARFSEIPAWIAKDQTYELFRHDVGFKTFMLLLANKVPSRKAENFRDEDHATKFVFLHCFFFKAICKPILEFCHAHPDIFVLPNSCLCRHPTVAVNQANPDPDDMRNTHRHCVIVFRTVEAYRTFKNFNTVNPDCLDALERSREISRNNALRARKFYRKEILSVSHYFKTIHYVSYPKIHEVDDKRNLDTQQALLDLADVDNEEEIFGEDGSADDGGVSHSSANVHFDITAPVFFHFRPLFYILYENGLSDWLAEAQSRSKSAVLDLTERIRVRRDGNTDISYNYIPLQEAIPFLCRYVVSHELGLRFDANAVDTGRLDQLDFFRQLKAPFVDLPNVNYSDAVLFDQAATFDIRIPDKLHSKVRSLIDLAHIDIRRNQQKDKTIRELSELVRNLQSYVSLMAKRLCTPDNSAAQSESTSSSE